MSNVSKNKPDVYQIITDQILEALDKGTVPWRRPWRGGSAGRPKSLATRKPYNGVNVWLLTMAAQAAGYNSPYWTTYKKAQELGGQVRKGEKSTVAVFWKRFEKERTNDAGKIEKDEFWMLRYYRVFNIDQCDNLNPDKLPIDAVPVDEKELDFESIEACESIVTNMPKRPEITHSDQRSAYYRPSTDEVHMPNKKHFETEEGYYCTLFHELAHSTGHEIRLNRKGDKKIAAFGSADYGKEELIAEFTSCMLCGITGIESATIDNSASYIDNWRKAIKKDRKLVVQAASAGQKAADYIRGI